MKIEVLYEVVKSTTIEVPDEVVKDMDFQAIWEELYRVEGLVDVGSGQILEVADAETCEILYE